MPIHWKNPEDHTGAIKDSYEGRVVSTRCREAVRIMSDVWANLFYALVWTGTEVVEVSTGNSEFGSESVVVDATPETLAAVKAWEEAEEAARVAAWEAAAPEREAQRLKEEAANRKQRLRAVWAYLNTPEKGDRVTVARRRGRNAPPKGTEGKVIWTGDSGMGTPRVGILDDSGAKHWTTAGNVDVIHPEGAPTDSDELEVWEAYVTEVEEAREAAAKAKAAVKKDRAEAELAALPQKGEWVRLKSDPNAFGKVFWRGVTRPGSARIGFKPDAGGHAHWAGFRSGEPEFDVLTGDPRTGGVPATPPAPAPVADESSTVTIAQAAPVEAPAPVEVEVEVEAPTPVVNPLAHLPAPFSEIARIEGNRAFTARGTFVAVLPQAVADDLVLSLRNPYHSSPWR